MLMKVETYTQCRLKKQLPDNANKQTTTWLPTQYAQVGRVLELKDDKGVWEDGWRVMSAGAVLPAKVAEARERNYKDFSYGREG